MPHLGAIGPLLWRGRGRGEGGGRDGGGGGGRGREGEGGEGGKINVAERNENTGLGKSDSLGKADITLAHTCNNRANDIPEKCLPLPTYSIHYTQQYAQQVLSILSVCLSVSPVASTGAHSAAGH